GIVDGAGRPQVGRDLKGGADLPRRADIVRMYKGVVADVVQQRTEAIVLTRRLYSFQACADRAVAGGVKLDRQPFFVEARYRVVQGFLVDQQHASSTGVIPVAADTAA